MSSLFTQFIFVSLVCYVEIRNESEKRFFFYFKCFEDGIVKIFRDLRTWNFFLDKFTIILLILCTHSLPSFCSTCPTIWNMNNKNLDRFCFSFAERSVKFVCLISLKFNKHCFISNSFSVKIASKFMLSLCALLKFETYIKLSV